jgi:hypothetical protein
LNPSPDLPPLGPNEFITWIKVERETFDIVGVLLASLGITGLCIALAAFLGSILGVAFIIRERRARQLAYGDHVGMHLGEPDPPVASAGA